LKFFPHKKCRITLVSFAEDQDIRYGFGRCGKADREHIHVIEIDYAWLGVVFHIVVSSERVDSAYNALSLARDDIETVKELSKQIVLRHLSENPKRSRHILETIHEASREQGHLEVVKHTMSEMNMKLDLADK